MVLGMREMERFLEQWEMDVRDVCRRLLLAPTPRERERWALGPGLDSLGYCGCVGKGSSHHRTVGRRLRRGRSGGLGVRAVRWFPPALGEAQQAELRGAVQELPGRRASAWPTGPFGKLRRKAVHQFVSERFVRSLSRSCCLTCLHRLGFVLKRPKKRLVKADEGKRASFVAEYAAWCPRLGRPDPRYSSADEAHFQADAELRGKWVLKGEPALVDSTSPPGEKKPVLLGGVLGDRRGGMDGTGGKQQRRNVVGLSETTE